MYDLKNMEGEVSPFLMARPRFWVVPPSIFLKS